MGVFRSQLKKLTIESLWGKCTFIHLALHNNYQNSNWMKNKLSVRLVLWLVDCDISTVYKLLASSVICRSIKIKKDLNFVFKWWYIINFNLKLPVTYLHWMTQYWHVTWAGNWTRTVLTPSVLAWLVVWVVPSANFNTFLSRHVWVTASSMDLFSVQRRNSK